nr:PqqD family protein [Acanthopleuribacter pedis]
MIRQDLIFRELEGCFVVYDPVCDTTAVLNVQAAAVLDFCDGTFNPDQIAAELADTFGTTAAAVAGQVNSLLQDFAAKGWLQSPGSAPVIEVEPIS